MRRFYIVVPGCFTRALANLIYARSRATGCSSLADRVDSCMQFKRQLLKAEAALRTFAKATDGAMPLQDA